MTVITASLEAPYPDRPNEGSVRFNVEFSPMASPAFEAGEPAWVLGSWLFPETIALAGNVLLVLLKEDKCWTVAQLAPWGRLPEPPVCSQ